VVEVGGELGEELSRALARRRLGGLQGVVLQQPAKQAGAEKQALLRREGAGEPAYPQAAGRVLGLEVKSEAPESPDGGREIVQPRVHCRIAQMRAGLVSVVKHERVDIVTKC
jgi:hypothetical protein